MLPRGLLLVLMLPALFAQRPDFEVRVLEDSSGNPLASAEARIQKTGAREMAADLDTGRDGIARASGLAPGEYTVTVAKPNYVAAQLQLRIPAEPMVVRLVHHGIISGQVTDAKGRPAAGRYQAAYGRTIGGARIAVLSKDLSLIREVSLDDDGRYRIYDLPPGVYSIGLWYDGLPDGSGMMLYPDTAHPRLFSIGGSEEYRGIDFQIASRPAVQVSGRVLQPKPKAQFALALGLPKQPLLPLARAISEEDGTFKFERVPSGTYDLLVAGPDIGYGGFTSLIDKDPLYARMRLEVGATNVTGLEIAVAPGKSVVVTLGPGKPPEGCPQRINIATRLLDPWAVTQRGAPQTVVFGKETTIAGLAPGRVEITAADLTGNCYAANAPVVDLGGEPPGPVTLDLASAGSLHGTLRGGAGYTVVLLDSDGAADARLATPDADGRFAFDSLKPGKYRIAARANGRWVSDPSRMTEIQIPGGSTTDIDLPAPPKGERQ